MIGHLNGILLEKNPPLLLLEVGGVGYEVEVSLTSFYRLPSLGDKIALYTHFIVREDAQLLYGFMEKSEQTLFRALIKISNVGPKLALAILSGMSPSEFIACIQQQDWQRLVKLPGVGKKTAERLIIELRDRLKPIEFTSFVDPGLTSARSEALQALVALGYTAAQAERALNNIKEELPTENFIRLALQNL